LTYKGCHSDLNHKILKMLVRGVGIRDVSDIEDISVKKVLSVLVNSKQIITPKQLHYDSLAASNQASIPKNVLLFKETF